MINLTKAQVSWESQVIAFKWYQNIGDALSHFAHFSSFLSETQREEALTLVGSYSNDWRTQHDELVVLKQNILIAPIKSDKPTIAKIQPSSL
jgi:hypothetical protein